MDINLDVYEHRRARAYTLKSITVPSGHQCSVYSYSSVILVLLGAFMSYKILLLQTQIDMAIQMLDPSVSGHLHRSVARSVLFHGFCSVEYGKPRGGGNCQTCDVSLWVDSLGTHIPQTQM